MRIRAYTLDVHAGHAPCWVHNKSKGCEILTLANCKPLIREVAPEGEWIAGVAPTRMGLNLAYLMQVTKRMRRADYWEQYKDSRLDSIYKPGGPPGQWIRLENPWHRDKESFETDLSSEWVLLSENFFVFAASYSETETQARGLSLPAIYSALTRGGMRGYGHFIELPDQFLTWIKEQPRLKLSQFRVLRNFGRNGCGCCKNEQAIRLSQAPTHL